MANFSETISRELLKHDIDLMRIDAGMRREIIGMLRNLEIKILDKIKRIDPSAPDSMVLRNKKLKQLVGLTAKDINKVYQAIQDKTAENLEVVATAEATILAQKINSAINVELVSGRLNKNVLKSLAGNTLIEGAPTKEWWAEQSRGLRKAFEREMREGVLNNETIQQLTQRVRGTKAAGFKDGIMQTSKVGAARLVRSSVLAVANEARYETYKENSDVIKGIQWVSTLDTRTSDICKALDGQAWYLDGRKMKGTTADWQGPPPAHWNCRSTTIPITRSWSELNKNPAIKEKLSKLPKRQINGLRASMDGAVSDRLDYEDWLRQVDEAHLAAGGDFRTSRAYKVLGPVKYDLWKRGKLTMADLIDQSHNPLTIPELKKKIGMKAKEDQAILAAEKAKLEVQEAAMIAQKELAKEEAAIIAKRRKKQVIDRMAKYQLQLIEKEKQPYLYNALQAIKKTKEGKKLKGKALLDAVQEKANKQKQSVLISNYKQAVIKGKEPSKASKAAYDALPDEAKTSIDIEVIKKKAELAAEKSAQEKLAKLKANPKGQTIKLKALEKLEKSGEAKKLSAVELEKKVNEVAAEMQAKATLASKVSQYKKAVINGKIPSPSLQAAFDSLDDAKKAKVLADIEKKKAKIAIADEKKFEKAPSVTKDKDVDFDNLVQIGPQKGSNPGGLYQDKTTGEKFYVKWPASEDIARNELLAAKLYELAGINVPELTLIKSGNKIGIASRIIDDAVQSKAKLTSGKITSVYEGFGTDAWLANWDVVGLGYDNVVMKGATAWRIDVGGSLRYRAQGGLKSTFGKEVTELDTLLDANMNPQSASVFKNMTKKQMEESIRRVLLLEDDDIKRLVFDYGPRDPRIASDLFDILIARRNYMRNKYKYLLDDKSVGSTSAVVTKQEVEIIEKSRLNGYVIRTDVDEIEDQSVLIWHEFDVDGNKLTVAQFKVRGKASDKMTALAKDVSEDVKYDDYDIDNKILEAIRGIGSQKNKGDVLREKDIARILEAKRAFESAKESITSLSEYGYYTSDDVKRFIDYYKQWINDLDETVLEIGLGNKVSYLPWADSKFVALRRIPSKPPKKAEREFSFSVRSGEEYLKDIKNGIAKRLKKVAANINEIPGSSSPVYVSGRIRYTKYKGAEIEYRLPDENDFALANTVNITVKGDGEKAIKKIFETIESLGINSKRASLFDKEELYLRKIAHARRTVVPIEIDNIKDVQERVARLRKFVSDDIGVDDVTKMPGYNYEGIRQAYGHGRTIFYRPDLEGQAWDKFADKYRVFHESTQYSLDEAIDRILNSGGQMASNTDKIRRGIQVGGMSPEADLKTGGADYFFTRIKTKSSAYKSRGFVWKADVLKRTDINSFDTDRYGRVTNDFAFKNARNDIDSFKKNSRVYNNETDFKQSLSIFDDLDKIVAKDEAERDRIITTFKKHKINIWPDGRSLEEVVIVRSIFG